jgi:hypothetical protein
VFTISHKKLKENSSKGYISLKKLQEVVEDIKHIRAGNYSVV